MSHCAALGRTHLVAQALERDVHHAAAAQKVLRLTVDFGARGAPAVLTVVGALAKPEALDAVDG